MRNAFELLLSADEDDPAKTIFAIEELKRLQRENGEKISKLATDWRQISDTYGE